MTYRYRNLYIAAPDYNLPTVTFANDQEQLTGQVQGKKASDLEERFASYLDRHDIPYEFRVRLTPLLNGARKLSGVFTNLLGEVEIDFLTYPNQAQPIMIDGFIAHFYATWMKDRDEEKTRVVDDFGKGQGWKETVRVPFTKLINQEMTDNTARDIFHR